MINEANALMGKYYQVGIEQREIIKTKWSELIHRISSIDYVIVLERNCGC